MASKGVSLIKLDGANVTADTETTAKSTNTAQLSLHFYGPISEDSCLELTQALFSLDKQAKYQKVENPPFVERGESAEIEFVPKQPLYLDTFQNCPGLGRIAVMDSNQLVMLGKVLEVEYQTDDKKAISSA